MTKYVVINVTAKVFYKLTYLLSLKKILFNVNNIHNHYEKFFSMPTNMLSQRKRSVVTRKKYYLISTTFTIVVKDYFSISTHQLSMGKKYFYVSTCLLSLRNILFDANSVHNRYKKKGNKLLF